MQNTDPNATPMPVDENAAIDNDIEVLTRQLADCEARLAEMRETVLRERADLDNQRKRMQRDLEQARLYANEKLLSALLPVLDNLERGLAAAGDLEALRGGVELTLRELLRVADVNGLRAVGAIGDVFDPQHHEAMSVTEGTEHPSGHIVSVMQKGYVLNDRLLRPALVSVSK
ncbi:nucleotide exchange factor GrpE [Dokdonella sp.]|uniref:nucleotide exchange factor GrpE n=1 Tax=Dokdonella sp. TaxID=2291710 RepID=UPI0031C7A56F|nr:nucleotide exchange factor GrpE [Dokdonella sp.]